MNEDKIDIILDHLYGELDPETEEEFLNEASISRALNSRLTETRRLLTAYRLGPIMEIPPESATNALKILKNEEKLRKAQAKVSASLDIIQDNPPVSPESASNDSLESINTESSTDSENNTATTPQATQISDSVNNFADQAPVVENYPKKAPKLGLIATAALVIIGAGTGIYFATSHNTQHPESDANIRNIELTLNINENQKQPKEQAETTSAEGISANKISTKNANKNSAVTDSKQTQQQVAEMLNAIDRLSEEKSAENYAPVETPADISLENTEISIADKSISNKNTADIEITPIQEELDEILPELDDTQNSDNAAAIQNRDQIIENYISEVADSQSSAKSKNTNVEVEIEEEMRLRAEEISRQDLTNLPAAAKTEITSDIKSENAVADKIKTAETSQKDNQKEAERLAQIEKQKEVERLAQLEKQKEAERLAQIEKQKEVERLAQIEKQKEAERLAQIEKQKEAEKLAQIEKQKEAERLAQIEKQKEAERLAQIEKQKEAERLAQIEKQKEAERLAQIEKQKEAERLAQIEKQKEAEKLAQIEKQKEEERLAQIEKQKEVERLAQIEKQKEVEKLAQIEKQKEEERLAQIEKQKEAEKLAQIEKQKEEERLAQIEKQKEVERLAQIEKQKEVEKLAQIEKQKEAEKLAQIEKQKEEERLAQIEKQKEVERLAQIEKQKEAERLAQIEKQKEAEKLAQIANQKEMERLAQIAKQKEMERLAQIEKQKEEEKLAQIEKQKGTSSADNEIKVVEPIMLKEGEELYSIAEEPVMALNENATTPVAREIKPEVIKTDKIEFKDSDNAAELIQKAEALYLQNSYLQALYGAEEALSRASLNEDKISALVLKARIELKLNSFNDMNATITQLRSLSPLEASALQILCNAGLNHNRIESHKENIAAKVERPAVNSDAKNEYIIEERILQNQPSAPSVKRKKSKFNPTTDTYYKHK